MQGKNSKFLHVHETTHVARFILNPPDISYYWVIRSPQRPRIATPCTAGGKIVIWTVQDSRTRSISCLHLVSQIRHRTEEQDHNRLLNISCRKASRPWRDRKRDGASSGPAQHKCQIESLFINHLAHRLLRCTSHRSNCWPARPSEALQTSTVRNPTLEVCAFISLPATCREFL